MGSNAADLKQSRIVETDGGVHKLLKRQIPSSRTVPLLNFGPLRSESVGIIDGNDSLHVYSYDTVVTDSYHSYKRPYFDTVMPAESRQLFTVKKDESKENLRTTTLNYSYGKEVVANSDAKNRGDVFRNSSVQKNLVQRTNLRKSASRYHYSESEKEDHLSSVDITDTIRRRIRARSESEPTDIRTKYQWPIANSREDKTNDNSAKRLREEQNSSVKPTLRSDDSVAIIDRMKESTPRILVYNNNPRTNSGTPLKKTLRHRASPVLASPRLNRARRCKTKSPSPNPVQIYSTASPIKTNLSNRKIRSTPPKSATVETKTKKLSPQRELSDSEGNEEDDSFDEDQSDGDGGHSSSDSEGAYKKHVYIQKVSSAVMQHVVLKGQKTTRFVTSLFPNVPPYLSFCAHFEKRPPMPQYLNKILKWRLTTVMPKLIRRILINSGFRLLKKTNEWMGTWGKHMKSPCFKTVRSYQKFNHIPGSFKIGRKDSCWRNLQAQMLKHGSKEFGFMPKTYVMPQDLKLLRRAWPKYSHRNCKWIIKPPASARGTGIKVINRWSQIPKRKSVIVQRYIERPYLINGSKFDLRLYILVTSINPLRVYMYKDGLVRFASVKYSEKPDSLNDRYMHLTNYSINKLSSTYAQNEDVNACKGHKWTIKSLWTYLKGRGIDTIKLWSALQNLVLRTILAGENSINAMFKLNVESKYNCFELFGFDVILDSELVPWLLEVNISPSLHSEMPLDLHVKGPLVQAVLNTALYHVPPKLSPEHQKQILSQEGLAGPLCNDKRMYVTYLSREEKLKHNQFTRKTLENKNANSILDNLTSDDIRCLIIAEDELQRCEPLERIFPNRNTHTYLKYTEMPRYYNLLLDAWEQKYCRNRGEGIQILQELCKQKLHLAVPSQPVRKPIKNRTRTLIVTTLKSTWPARTKLKRIKLKKKAKQTVTNIQKNQV